MLANIQRVVIVLLVLAAAASGRGSIAAGHEVMAIVLVGLIAMSYAFFLAAEFALLYVTVRRASLELSLGRVLHAWIGEVVSTPRVFFWRQPFFAELHADHLPPSAPGRRGLLLVHGLFCNRGFWNPWLVRLRDLDVPFVAIDLEPVFGSIDDYRHAIERAVNTLEAATGRPVAVVGHSMGGLALRAWIADGANIERIDRVFTIGTPHQGTWLARYSSTISGREMRIGSQWLADLATRESVVGYAKFTCFYSECDNVVFPSTGAVLPHADNIRAPDAGHVRLAFKSLVFDTVSQSLESQRPTGHAGRPS